MVGNARSRELCEALELAQATSQADHFRFFTSNHSRPVAATINTTMMLHGVDEAGSSFGSDCFAASDGLAFVGGKERLGAVGTAAFVGVADAP